MLNSNPLIKQQLGSRFESARVFWDFSRAKFGSGPEPRSGFYIAIVSDGEMVLLVGDCVKEAYRRSKTRGAEREQVMVLRREHVYGNKLYRTTADLGGKEREICIDCRNGEDPRLEIAVDNRRVLLVKHLKWKFRGNERIEMEGGVQVQVSWDVYNWLFEEDQEEGYALFMFRFQQQGLEENAINGGGMWSQQQCGFGFETKMMRKGLLMRGRRRTARTGSSSSLSSANSSSSCNSSVMEWSSVEEEELKDPPGFSLLVYAWKS